MEGLPGSVPKFQVVRDPLHCQCCLIRSNHDREDDKDDDGDDNYQRSIFCITNAASKKMMMIARMRILRMRTVMIASSA